MAKALEIPQRPQRVFLNDGFKLETWDDLAPYYQELQERDPSSKSDLILWLKDRSELESVISEDMAWRYIKMTTDTANEEFQKSYATFVTEIQPKISPLNDALNRKVLASKHLDELEKDPAFRIMFRSMKKAVEIFRQENVPVFTAIQTETKKYGEVTGAMTVTMGDQEFTLQQAGQRLEDNDRQVREEVYRKIQSRRLDDRKVLNRSFDKLIKLRHKAATNAGFENFRDFMFAAMGRFDYSKQDCFDFHSAVKEEVVPLVNKLAKARKGKLGVSKLKPWDKAVDPSMKGPLKAFDGASDLIDKTIKCFDRLGPELGEKLSIMKEMGHLDLESRKGKSPGGYNYPLAEIGVPFIFMNATSTVRDMVTLLHEGGHAVHSFVSKDLMLSDFKSITSEVAELASMTMELISLDAWDVYFDNKEDLKRAKLNHLNGVISTLPWVALIDKFQHWIYENPEHSLSERNKTWLALYDQYSDQLTDWDGLHKHKTNMWQRQLHLYQVPFYYIEYGFAQLGAIAMWRNFKNDPEKTLKQYIDALSLGYTRTIPELYEAAGIKFAFDRQYIKELMSFVEEQIAEISGESH